MKTIEVEIEPHFAGDYRLEYCGKYISLYGRDRNFKQFQFHPVSNPVDEMFEEMILIPVVIEVRNANPQIIEITSDKIIIDLGL